MSSDRTLEPQISKSKVVILKLSPRDLHSFSSSARIVVMGENTNSAVSTDSRQESGRSDIPGEEPRSPQVSLEEHDTRDTDHAEFQATESSDSDILESSDSDTLDSTPAVHPSARKRPVSRKAGPKGGPKRMNIRDKNPEAIKTVNLIKKCDRIWREINPDSKARAPYAGDLEAENKTKETWHTNAKRLLSINKSESKLQKDTADLDAEKVDLQNTEKELDTREAELNVAKADYQRSKDQNTKAVRETNLAKEKLKRKKSEILEDLGLATLPADPQPVDSS